MGAAGDREQPAADLHKAAGAAQREADVMSAFAAALDLLFADPNLSTPALYVQMGVGPGVEIRVMRRSPDRMVEFGAARRRVG